MNRKLARCWDQSGVDGIHDGEGEGGGGEAGNGGGNRAPQRQSPPVAKKRIVVKLGTNPKRVRLRNPASINPQAVHLSRIATQQQRRAELIPQRRRNANPRLGQCGKGKHRPKREHRHQNKREINGHGPAQQRRPGGAVSVSLCRVQRNVIAPKSLYRLHWQSLMEFAWQGPPPPTFLLAGTPAR